MVWGMITLAQIIIKMFIPQEWASTLSPNNQMPTIVFFFFFILVCGGMLWDTPPSVLTVRWYWHCDGHASAAVSRRDHFSADFLGCRLLESFCVVFHGVFWITGPELRRSFIRWDEGSHVLLISALCPDVVFCDRFYVLYKRGFFDERWLLGLHG